MRRRVVRLMMATSFLVVLGGCGNSGGGVATNPPVTANSGGTTSSTPTATATGVRTVLSPLGLNLHSTPSTSASKLGAASQGTVLTVLAYSSQNGGWYQVKGQTTTGWITADATLSAAGYFQTYNSSSHGFSALYPQDWTFVEETADVVFRPQQGSQSIVVRNGPGVSSFGSSNAGYVGSGQATELVCGVTANLLGYTRSPSAASPTPNGTVMPQSLLEVIDLSLDSTHALELTFNYSDKSQAEVFADFYNSLTFPFPQCEQTATPSPSPSGH